MTVPQLQYGGEINIFRPSQLDVFTTYQKHLVDLMGDK